VEMGCLREKDSDRKERRKVTRIEDNIFIFCKSKRHYETLEGIAKDISEKGLKFESDEFIPPSTVMGIEIYQPADCRKDRIVSIYVLAEVIWVKEIEKGSRYKGSNKYVGGVKFTKIGKQNRDLILNYVRERFRKEHRSP